MLSFRGNWNLPRVNLKPNETSWHQIYKAGWGLILIFSLKDILLLSFICAEWLSSVWMPWGSFETELFINPKNDSAKSTNMRHNSVWIILDLTGVLGRHTSGILEDYFFLCFYFWVDHVDFIVAHVSYFVKTFVNAVWLPILSRWEG